MDAFSESQSHRRSQVLATAGSGQAEAWVRLGPAGQSPTDGLTAISHIFNTLRRRWRLVAYTVLAGTVVAVLTMIIFPPFYMATAQLILADPFSDNNDPGKPPFSPNPFSTAAEESAIDTHITALTSDSNLLNALRSLGALQETAAGKHNEARRLAEHAALIRMRPDLKVRQELRSRIIAVSFLDRDPAKAAQIANAVVRTYLDSLNRDKRADAEAALSRFDQRLADVHEAVTRAEMSVHDFRQAHTADSAAGPGQTGQTEQQIAQAARQLALLKSDAAAGQKKLQNFRSLRSQDASTSELAKALDSPRLLELAEAASRKLRGGDKTDPSLPALLRAIDDEISTTTARLEMEQATYDSQIQSIEGNLGLLRGTAAQTNNDTIALQGLERNASALGQVYESLLRQRQDLLERTKSPEPDIRPLNFAEVPFHASSLNRLYLIPPAFIAFLLLGSMLALTLDRLDHTLHGERETADALQVPCVGLLPRLTANEQKSIFRLLAESPRAPYSKAIRHIFIGTAPQFRSDPDHKIIMVTSSVPSEEKTNLAWSLALSAAQLRWHVLVVEAGHQTSALRAHALKLIDRSSSAAPPFADVIANQRPLTSAIRSIGGSSISFLSLGAEANLLRVVTDPAFAEALSQIRDTYDLVIVDAPSVFDSSEVRLLVSKVDKVLFAVRWGKTPRETAARAVQMVQVSDQNDPNVLDKVVSILTAVDIQQHARYRFADQGDFLNKEKV